MENGLSRIRIKNYQSIKDADLKLGNITVITGKSDSGKSAFFRAVKGAVTNEAGEEYITKGEKKCSVQLDEVKWIQSKLENRYEIGDRVWEKCGRGVPEDVCETLCMKDYEFGSGIKALLNFHGQLDRAFIVQGNPSDNAKIIGSISNIHIIYNALREAEKDTKNIKKRMNILQEQFEEYDGKLKHDGNELDKLEGLYVKLKGIYHDVMMMDQDIAGLEKIQDVAVIVKRDLKFAKAENVRYAGMEFERVSVIVEHIEVLVDLQEEYNVVIGKMQGLADDYMRYKSISPDKCLKILNDIERLTQAKSQLQRVGEDISDEDEIMGGIVGNLVIANKEKEAIEKLGKYCEECGAKEIDWNLDLVKGD